MMNAVKSRPLRPLHPRCATLQEMTVLYNLSNEPCLKYNMAAIADRGLKPSQWTSARFQTQVLLVESSR